MRGVCKGFGYSMVDCFCVFFSVNVVVKVKSSFELKSDGEEEK